MFRWAHKEDPILIFGAHGKWTIFFLAAFAFGSRRLHYFVYAV